MYCSELIFCLLQGGSRDPSQSWNPEDKKSVQWKNPTQYDEAGRPAFAGTRLGK